MLHTHTQSKMLLCWFRCFVSNDSVFNNFTSDARYRRKPNPVTAQCGKGHDLGRRVANPIGEGKRPGPWDEVRSRGVWFHRETRGHSHEPPVPSRPAWGFCWIQSEEGAPASAQRPLLSAAGACVNQETVLMFAEVKAIHQTGEAPGRPAPRRQLVTSLRSRRS